MGNSVNIAIVGVGNCASALIQGLAYYRDNVHQQQPIGLMNLDVGGYSPADIRVAAAFDIDQRKVGQDVAIAIFAPPNCAAQFHPEIDPLGVTVSRGCTLDGFSDHLQTYPEDRRCVPSDHPDATKEEIVDILKTSNTDVLINYLPVGSEKAARFYAECALEANVGFVNCIPVFIASDPVWAARFSDANLPIIGDDIKSQLGATITHRVLSDLFKQRGVKIETHLSIEYGGQH